MKIVILDGYTENPGDLSWDSIKKFGDVIIYDRTPNDKAIICKNIDDADVVFTNKVPLDKDVFAACPKIKFINILATGYDIIDIKSAKDKGIIVSNIPSYGTDAVAQFAIALLLELCHHIGMHDQAVKNGQWSACPDWCFWNYPLIELSNKTMGIIGFGKIGQKTGQIAKALGMNILAYNPSQNDIGRSIAEYVDFNTLLSASDVIVLHCPLTSKTKGIINKDSLFKMKTGALLINNSRGALICEQDLADALNSEKLLGAALDVVCEEPIKPDNPLLTAKNCILTPHISWAALETRKRIMSMAAKNLEAFLSGAPINVVSN